MINWLQTRPAVLLVVLVLAGAYVVAAVIYLIVTRLGSGERLTMMSSLSPGLLSPLGVVFGLIVVFMASGIWSNASTAQAAVNNEASALRAAVLLARVFPPQPDREIQILIARQIDESANQEWPEMARGTASISTVPALGQALQVALRLTPRTAGQTEAQRQLITQLQAALDARRMRIIVSHAQVNAVKWAAVTLLGVLLLVAIALVHAARRGTAAIALAIFATAVGLSLVLLLSQDRPFSGPFGIKPTALEQVRPQV